MIRRLVTLVAVAAALTACSNSSNSSGNKPSNGGGDPVAWAEKVCKSVESQLATMAQSPNIDPNDPKQAKESLLAYLGSFATALDRIAGGIKDAGNPPVADGSQVVDKVTNAMQDAKKSVEDARANLEKASVTDPQSFQQAYTKVGEDMSKVSNMEDPTKDLKANKELNDAFGKAPTCMKLDASGPSTPPTT
jgi:hypothetical protein